MLSHSPEGSLCLRIYQVSNDTKALIPALDRRFDFNIMVHLVRQLITVYLTHEFVVSSFSQVWFTAPTFFFFLYYVNLSLYHVLLYELLAAFLSLTLNRFVSCIK